tara:strand:+ start:2838 stop:3035 length:198 start_codon:yes stop_codon:yes gene_type:complete
MIYKYALIMNKVHNTNHIYIRKIFDKSWKCVLRSRRRMKLLEEMEKRNKPINEKINAYKNVSKDP